VEAKLHEFVFDPLVGLNFLLIFMSKYFFIYNKVSITEVVISEIGRSFAPGIKFAPNGPD
jgi:hypothetical protein